MGIIVLKIQILYVIQLMSGERPVFELFNTNGEHIYRESKKTAAYFEWEMKCGRFGWLSQNDAAHNKTSGSYD